MLVYGDPGFDHPLCEFAPRLRAGVDRLLSSAGVTPRPSLDGLRTLLIRAGQFEQAIADAPGDILKDAAGPALDRLATATDHLADAFVADIGDAAAGGVYASLILARAALDSVPTLPDVLVRVKVPEGFAFYALYPEQYHAACLRWVDRHAQFNVRDAIVIGVRSIGTTLSAVVAATLRARGWRPRRMTVRPTGHPFDRRVEVSAAEVEGATHALIVDEGPGLSGSSMASVGEALVRAGMARDGISFFPGHNNAPGAAASEEVRRWWSTTPRYVVPLSELRWRGQTLTDVLGAHASAHFGGVPLARVDDLSAGQWRGIILSDERQWPPAFPAFERTKYRCTLRDGRAVLWKFAGLAAVTGASDDATGVGQAVAAVRSLARLNFAPAPLPDGVLGFLGTEWIEGVPLTRADATPELLAHIGRYIRAASNEAPPAATVDIDFDRVAEMLVCNVRESLGDQAAERANHVAHAARARRGEHASRSYGDGQLAPHEWIRTASGAILKTDAQGHATDHTLIGRQPMAWDVAGAIVEWGLEERANLTPLICASGSDEHPTVLRFYKLAYAAFRLGMCQMIGAGLADARVGISVATEWYRAVLVRGLFDSSDK